MNALTLALAAVGALLVLALVGALASRQARLQAPARLEAARLAWEGRDAHATLARLSEALHLPLDDRFSPADAALALEALALLDELLRAQGADPEPLLGSLRGALQDIARHGGEVPRRLSGPVKATLDRAAVSPDLAARLVAELSRGASAPEA